MAQRVKIVQPHEEVKRIPSGSTLLDLVLGGGWGIGRIANIVGDKSTGKTLLAIEAFANFKRRYPKGRMRYGEAEAAFDESYASIMGFPGDVSRPDKPMSTVEEWYEDLKEFSSQRGPALYVLDSLDALSDAAEMARDLAKGSYGAEKAKKLSEMFRRIIRQLETNECGVIIISQIRDRIGVMFGETKMRAGGRALDFYASQVVWLAELGKIERQIKHVKRAYGVEIRAKARKMKLGNPQRECEFNILFGYGVDDEGSMLDFLKETKTISPDEVTDYKQAVATMRARGQREELAQFADALAMQVKEVWAEIEDALAQPMRKY